MEKHRVCESFGMWLRQRWERNVLVMFLVSGCLTACSGMLRSAVDPKKIWLRNWSGWEYERRSTLSRSCHECNSSRSLIVLVGPGVKVESSW